jgi:hypothetical protein
MFMMLVISYVSFYKVHYPVRPISLAVISNQPWLGNRCSGVCDRGDGLQALSQKILVRVGAGGGGQSPPRRLDWDFKYASKGFAILYVHVRQTWQMSTRRMALVTPILPRLKRLQN